MNEKNKRTVKLFNPTEGSSLIARSETHLQQHFDISHPLDCHPFWQFKFAPAYKLRKIEMCTQLKIAPHSPSCLSQIAAIHE